MMSMQMPLDVVVAEIERLQGLHVRYSQRRAQVKPVRIAPAATFDFLPWFAREHRQRLVRLAAHSYVAADFSQCRGGGCGCVRANRDLHRLTADPCEPLLGNTNLRRGASPEEV